MNKKKVKISNKVNLILFAIMAFVQLLSFIFTHDIDDLTLASCFIFIGLLKSNIYRMERMRDVPIQ